MKERTRYVFWNDRWTDKDMELGHPYRITRERPKGYTLIGHFDFLDHADWIQIGASQRTTLGRIVFRRELGRFYEE